MEWPTWELQAHGSAAPALAPDPAAPDDPAGPRGPGCPLPRLDPLGPWCSARLTFADGARVDVLVTVSDDRITVEDVRADPPLTLTGLTDLARWIEGPLDDAFRAATGRPRRTRPAPRQPGPAATSPERGGRPPAGPQTEPGKGAAPDPATGARPNSPNGPTSSTPRPMAGTAPGREPRPEPRGAGAGVTAGEGVAPAPQGAAAAGEGPTGPTGVARGDSAVHGTATPGGTGHPAEPSAEVTAEPAAEPSAEPSPALAASPASSTPAPASTPATSPTPAGSVTSNEPPPASAKPSERARSAVLARSRAGERRRIAADAYRQAQRDGCDPVLAVMLATGRNRRRALRLIAGARDEGLLTPRHNKR
ncbi:DUF6214 family protein [Streptomyces sp. MCA2]|uniref:DUF6214 family protein n=1 Tax=Streptomyces sp. MCA2 TaxID=2944805 RepID=UPI002021B4CD|nr:DUF6214 family protein [Streptomyces sp. MCA2]MCL7495497.1 DUF6214 family protein [Streptomyces sp. MCA2]